MKLAYKTYGTLAPAKDNAVLITSWCSANHVHNEWFIGPGRHLNSDEYFIISINLLGNGLSSSPSNTAPPFDRGRFPPVTILDNVRLQKKMVDDRWGIGRFALVFGRSMGGQIAFQWASYFPDRVASMLAMTSAAKTSPHTYIFLEGIMSAIRMDPAWKEGEYVRQPEAGLRMLGRLYAAWSMSQTYYRQGLHKQEVADAKTLEDYLIKRWDRNFFRCDANDLLSQFKTWQCFDISANEKYRGSLEDALGAISARAIVMPGQTDLYFPVEDSAMVVSHMPSAELRVIESVWGHRAGAPGSPEEDTQAVKQAIRDCLDGER